MVDEKKAESESKDKKNDVMKDLEAAEEDLSEEDAALKEKLDMLVVRAMDRDSGVQKLALETIRSEVRTSTSSMTSVPKPLKFLRHHYPKLKEYFASASADDPASVENRTAMADILSVLAMTMAEEGSRESLSFKLQGSTDAPQSWGHEYVRSLCGEIGQEYNARMDAAVEGSSADEGDPMIDVADVKVGDLMALVDEIVPFLISSNAESEACDLLMEVESVHKLEDYIDQSNYSRVGLYLQSCASYLPEPEDKHVLKVATKLYVKVGKLPEAVRVALRLGDSALVTEIFDSCKEETVKRQLAFDLARHNAVLKSSEELDDSLTEIAGNCMLSQQFLKLAKDLEVLEAKTPDDIYKTHLVETRNTQGAQYDSALQNLASTLVNAFVNLGFGNDKLLGDEENKWIFRNKDHGIMAAVASVGMINQWDIDGGLSKVDKFFHATDINVKAGGFLAVGLVCATIRSGFDAALALLCTHVENVELTSTERSGAIAGLGIAYAGTAREEVLELLTPIAADSDAAPELSALAALSLGLVYVGSADENLASTLIQAIAERSESGHEMDNHFVHLAPLALGLLFLGKQESVEAVCETLSALVTGQLEKICLTTLEACAYAGTGNVLKVQHLLGICGQHIDAQDPTETPAQSSQASPPTPAATAGNGAAEDGAAPSANPSETGAATAGDGAATPAESDSAMSDAQQPEPKRDTPESLGIQKGIATIGLAMVAMGEELGSAMCLRTFDHLLQYGDIHVRRSIPLAVSLLSISHPQVNTMDTLSKLTHDTDEDVARGAILGIGIIGAGTNNSRAANMLRQLSAYYAKDAKILFSVRIAQGLLHAGKGLVTLNPFHSDRGLLNPVALAGILTVVFSSTNMNGTLLGKSPWLIYNLALSCRPRMVYVVDEELQPLAIPVRVGQAVDTVGQAGRPKTITGFQTHTAPVLLSAGERAELATEEYIAVTPTIEGCVIVKKNPDYEEPEQK